MEETFPGRPSEEQQGRLVGMTRETRVTIVTGAGQGIGRAFALRFAAEGYSVVLADIDARKARAVEQEIHEAGGVARAILAATSKPRAVASSNSLPRSSSTSLTASWSLIPHSLSRMSRQAVANAGCPRAPSYSVVSI